MLLFYYIYNFTKVDIYLYQLFLYTKIKKYGKIENIENSKIKGERKRWKKREL